jgi:hypothetical protein
MAMLLLLCSLLLAALGVTAAAFAVHGYVGEYLQDRHGPAAATQEHTAAAQLLMRPRARFVLLEPPARAHRSQPPAGASTPTGAKPKAKAFDKAAGAEARRAAAKTTPDPPWPWSLLR